MSLLIHPVFSAPLPQTTISDIHAFDDQTIIVGTHEGVFKTEDGGENWLPMNAVLSNTVIQNLYVLNQNTLFARVFGTGNTLFKSHDGGKSWNVLNQNFMDVSYFYALDSNTLFAGATDDGLFASTDGGRKWTRISSFYALNDGTLFAGSRFGELFKSNDAGEHWELLGQVSMASQRKPAAAIS